MNHLQKVNICSPHAQYEAYRSEIDAALANVLIGGNYILGEEVEAFEREFAAYVGVKFGIGVASGTDALIIALLSMGIGPKDEVIIPAMTSVANAMAVLAVGAKPILADVDPKTSLMTVENTEFLIGKNTKAIVPVHLYGASCKIDALLEMADAFGLPIIEDCSQAHGATWKNKTVGSFGKVACFSFYPTKNLGAFGDGGLIITDNQDLASRIQSIRQYGFSKHQVSTQIGRCSRLDELQAAILRIKLRYLDDMNDARVQVAFRYDTAFSELPIMGPEDTPANKNVYHQYVIKLKEREELAEFLGERKIETAIHYRLPIHRQPFWKNQENKNNQLPWADGLAEQILSIPMDPFLSIPDQKYVINNICQFYDQKV